LEAPNKGSLARLEFSQAQVVSWVGSFGKFGIHGIGRGIL